MKLCSRPAQLDRKCVLEVNTFSECSQYVNKESFLLRSETPNGGHKRGSPRSTTHNVGWQRHTTDARIPGSAVQLIYCPPHFQ